MKAIVSVIGKDKPGIIAGVSGVLYKLQINIEDITQTIMQKYFTMIMTVELEDCDLDFKEIAGELSALGASLGVEVRIQLQSIFDSMHAVSYKAY